jgi:hypothetical protein
MMVLFTTISARPGTCDGDSNSSQLEVGQHGVAAAGGSGPGPGQVISPQCCSGHRAEATRVGQLPVDSREGLSSWK